MRAFLSVSVSLAVSVIAMLFLLFLGPVLKAQPSEVVPHILEALIERWNKGIDRHNVDWLQPCYGDQVVLDGEALDRAALLEKKRKLFNHYPGYRQFVGEVEKVDAGNGKYRVYFEATSLKNGKSTVTKAYLDFAPMQDGELRIVGEGSAEEEVAIHKTWPYVKMGKRDYCFISLGKILKKGAVPSRYEQEYRIRVTEDYRLIGGGSFFSPVSRTKYHLRIRGALDGKGILNMDIEYQAENYDPDSNPDGQFRRREQWKFNGEGIGWVGGDRPDVLYLGQYHCK